MRFTLRTRLIVIAGTAAMAFILLIIASAFITNRVRRELSRIEGSYLPKIELAPKLERQFTVLARHFQDAVAAQDLAALNATSISKRDFLSLLDSAPRVVSAADEGALKGALDDYYVTAFRVSQGLIAGETGEALIESMAAMQSKQRRVDELITQASSLDRDELASAFSSVSQELVSAGQIRLIIGVSCLVLVLFLSIWLGRSMVRSLSALTFGFQRFGEGAFDVPILVMSHDEIGDVAEKANQMAQSLKNLSLDREQADWLKAGLAGLTQQLRGEREPEEVANLAIGYIARHLGVPAAALYIRNRDDVFELFGHYALDRTDEDKTPKGSFAVGQGLVGQAALRDEIMVVTDLPAKYLRIQSGLGEASPQTLALVPLWHAGKVTAVLELAAFKPWSALHMDLLLSVRETLAITLEGSVARAETRALLLESQQQAMLLSQQEECLRSTNEELQAQQEELRQTNEELSHQTEELEAQRETLQERNDEIEKARKDLQRKADELATVSAYKSQFLTNMSHELRTPLNSMLLLSSLLSENDSNNLTGKQVEYCKTIHSAGKDLLALINQVLDLAKVESGKQEIKIGPVEIEHLVTRAQRLFEPLAKDKGLTFETQIEPGIAPTLMTDGLRVEQIITNLLGNAIKFTERGGVSLHIHKAKLDVKFRRPALLPEQMIAISVTDTGSGIDPQHQERIFAPFEQVEGKIDRRYGGTGLGLSIARELAVLLGGEIQLQSSPGNGSTFTCYLPSKGAPVAGESPTKTSQASDNEQSKPALFRPKTSDGPDLLIIEDDRIFSEAFGDVIAAQGLSYLLAKDGESGIKLARESLPRGIILDVRLPDMDGFAVLDRLRADPKTANIPVHFASAVDAAVRGMAKGAVGYLVKPASRTDLLHAIDLLVRNPSGRENRILIVEDDVALEKSLLRQFDGEELTARRVTSARAALMAIQNESFGCMVLDLALPDMSGLELLQTIQERCGAQMPAVVIYTARPLSKAEVKQLEAYTEAIVLKEGHSSERLLNEVRLFVRRLKEGLSPRQPIANQVHRTNVRLEGRKIMIVDDDMRTVYALSASLRAKGAEILAADTGKVALETLSKAPDVDAVLMDIMMPEMDGYEAMRRIREQERFQNLHIIALTAKAMKGDEEKCKEAGANDYLPKPIDTDSLLALLDRGLSQGNPGAN